MRLVSTATCAALCASAFAFAGPAQAASPFLTGTADAVYNNADGSGAFWAGQTAAASGDLARIDVSWRATVVSAGAPANPRSPGDPGYDFSAYDVGVRNAVAQGLEVMITVQSAPDWAEGRNSPPPGPLNPPGSWKPDPKALGKFAEALARRYSGKFQGLPRVRYFEAWNEPNISLFLNPQWRGDERVAPEHYRKMLNAFHAGVHRASKGAKVIAGGTAPFGSDEPNGIRIRPLDFMRELLCVRGKRKLERACAADARFDIYAHHPINLNGGPRKSSIDYDDLSAAADIGRLVRILRAAERFGTTTAGRHPVWATEVWWETDPPDGRDGFTLKQQADYYQEAMYLLHKNGVTAMVLLQIVDSPFTPAGHGERNGFQSGLFFVDGRPKPSLTAFSFPFVTERRSPSQIVAWTIPPRAGKLVIQRKLAGGWRTVKRAHVRGDRPFQATLTMRGSATFRAMIGGRTSLSWTQGRTNGGPQPAAAAASADESPTRLAPYVEEPPR